ncbi:MAG: MFS transporter [Bryobacterales bacterium]|nr:MFS transporter [Bryobacterales bacterium]
MTTPALDSEERTYRKVTRRLIPFLFVCYVLAYVDRVNVGFAKLQMQQDLGMSDAVYGMGAGIFFIGYFFFEVPANMMLQKLGARRWLGPIMIAWGVVSAATMFVQGPRSFYALRFLLGIVESGFFPGVILYLTYWYTRKHRAKMVAGFMAANPISGVLAGPVSGWILANLVDAGGLRAWQWLFLLEGIPSVIAGVVTLFYLADNPRKAKWLSPGERELVLRRLEEEEETKRREGESRHRLVDAFKSGKVWLLSLIYFGAVAGNYGLWFWLPQVIKDTLTADPWRIGLITIIPWGSAAVAMVLYGHHSDAKGERRWHLSLALLFGAAAFSLSALPGISGVMGLAALTCSAASVMCGQSLFWALPTAILSGSAAAAGIAWINSVGNLAGYVSPSLIGFVRDSTGSMTLALLALAGFMLMSSLLVMAVARPRK